MSNSYAFKFKPSPALQLLKTGKTDVLDDYYETRLALFNLSILADYDQLVCLPALHHVDKYWYQIETTKKVIKQFGGRALLADEVGLGKTIEACMVCKEYFVRGMIKSLLILTPASLVSQWQQELSDKFDITTISTDERQEEPEIFWNQNDSIVASIHTAKHKAHRDYVTGREWDMVIVDEAHHLKNRNTLNWKLVNSIKKRFILMLTATPVQNSLVELFNLLTLLKPGLLKTEALFKKEYVSSKSARVPKNPEKLRQLMREVMVRNTRSLVDVQLPKRFASTITVQPSKAEQTLYQAISDYLRQYQDDRRLKLMRNTLLMRVGSSPKALADSLTHLEKRFKHKEIKPLIKKATAIQHVEKAKQLLALLKKSSQKTLVFVTHRETQAYLATCLSEAGIAFAEFRGDMSLTDKDEAIESFRELVPVLLTTEAGGEGRNIQFANVIINYDLPWNPMRIEQRIGRIHRIGQTQDVFIFNFCVKGSIEEYILRVLHDKINMFELVVGEIESILGNVDDSFDFSDTVMALWLKNQSQQALGTAFDTLASDLLKAKENYQETSELDEQIFGEDFEA
ncbi:MAG: ATP-dependent helicase [Candidatus Parabeggiatoa sp. nov. 1]|nr:MAG: ATP-dependent helicase [Gammaproteobacteria bacterium]